MPRRFLLPCVCISILAAAFACVADEPAPGKQPAKQFVEVKLWVIEVSESKLRNMGFDWDRIASRPGSTIAVDEKLNGFLEALEQNKLASTLAKPMIATQSGRTASLEIAPFRKFVVTPTVLDAEQIAFDYHVEVATRRDAEADQAGTRLVSACTTELKSGVVQLLSETTFQHRTAQGKPSQTTLLVLAQATIVK